MFAALFIDVGTNYSVLDHTNLSFIYEDVLTPGPNADGEFVSRVYALLSRNTAVFVNLHASLVTHTHTHSRLAAYFYRTTWVGRYQKNKPSWILLKQR